MSGNTSATGGFVQELTPPPPTAKEVEAIFQVMVATLAGLPGTLVRPRWQPTPPVQPPVETNWAAVGVVSTEADEFPWIGHIGGDPAVPGDLGHDVMQRHQTVTAMVSFYGPEAEDHAQRMRDALYVAQNSEPFSLALQAKIYSVADFNRIPELINQQWVNRIDMRLMLRQQIDRVYPILDIASALINVVTDTGRDEDVVVIEP
jgi:hypothetical protein